MADVAPTTYLAGCKINWTPYILSAVEAVRTGERIEDCVDATVHGQDAGAGFDKGWVEMLELNEVITAAGTQERVDEMIEQLKEGTLTVFQGDYTGVNPTDAADTIDLREGYQENADCSAPTFDYVLKNVITIE
jgi:basic membrane protein A